MSTMEVILREKIQGLGAEADLVKVKAGYGRNFLIPQGKAHEATSSNRRYIEALKAIRIKREAEEREQAQELAAKISKAKIALSLEVGQGGKAFGAITNQDIHDALVAKGIKIDRHLINLEKPIKQAGKSELEIKLQHGVVALLTVNVEVKGEEA